MKFNRLLQSILVLLLYSTSQDLYAQPGPYSAAQIQVNLQRLNTLGSILHIAAHPDDENTLLLAYFARERHLRTAYLSLTRGEGGQNLIGPEQANYLGLIRTQELLAARRIDGAEQFFSRAIDFGFSKTATETLSKWGREQVLSDIVWTIRSFRPDVIFLRFSGTPRDGHGHHQSSAILGKEAFTAAADPKRFPEQLRYVKPWQARRLLYNIPTFTREMEQEAAKAPGKMEVDAGVYNPLLGLSYGEVAGRSRSQHESQGMGSSERRGSQLNYLTVIGGEPATKDPLEGIDTTWNRLPGGGAVAAVLADAIRSFQPAAPQRTLPALVQARKLIAAISHPDARKKLSEVDELMLTCAGIWVDASAKSFAVTPGSQAHVILSVVSRVDQAAQLVDAKISGVASSIAQGRSLAYNKPVDIPVDLAIPSNAPVSQPYWLVQPEHETLYVVSDQTMIGLPESSPALTAQFRFSIDGTVFDVTRPVIHRYVDSVRGELIRPFIIVPAVTVEFADSALIFPSTSPRTVPVTIKANQPNASGRVRLELPSNWRIEPLERAFQLSGMNEQSTVSFQITPPEADSSVNVTAVAEMNGARYARSQRVINYPHIPPQTEFPPATARLVRAEIKVTSKNIGYVMGAGDQIPEALRQLGLVVHLLSDDELASGNLTQFDTIVAGIRAFNTRPAMRANFQRLLDFASNGGTLVVQYNVLEFFGRGGGDSVLSKIGPYPVTIDRARVTVEESPVNLTSHPVLESPNKITKQDFDGWVQERGLYFAKSFDPHYTSLFSTHDPDEDWLPGGMLYAKYGKGAYVFTAYSWFRQLPAGVPGAYRIFANLLSAK